MQRAECDRFIRLHCGEVVSEFPEVVRIAHKSRCDPLGHAARRAVALQGAVQGQRDMLREWPANPGEYSKLECAHSIVHCLRFLLVMLWFPPSAVAHVANRGA